MARIVIYKRPDPIFMSNDRAKKVKEMLNRYMENKVNEYVDLGDWAGPISHVQQIDLDGERQNSPVLNQVEMTAEELERSKQAMLKAKQKLIENGFNLK